jgi:hypothetical protein
MGSGASSYILMVGHWLATNPQDSAHSVAPLPRAFCGICYAAWGGRLRASGSTYLRPISRAGARGRSSSLGSARIACDLLRSATEGMTSRGRVTGEWGRPVSGTGEEQRAHHGVGPCAVRWEVGQMKLVGQIRELSPNAGIYSFSFFSISILFSSSSLQYSIQIQISFLISILSLILNFKHIFDASNINHSMTMQV